MGKFCEQLRLLIVGVLRMCGIKSLSRSLHTGLHAAIRHGHTIGVHLLVSESGIGILHAGEELTDALSMTDRAILMLDEEVSKITDFIVEGCNL